MDSVAQAWLVYRLTGSSALLGLVSFSNLIPVFLISPVGGYVADRWNRHRIIVITQAASMVLALTLAALTLTGRIRIPELFVLASLLGIVNAFDIPARQSFLVEMVGRDDLINAIALNSSMFNGARIVGPAVAGLLVAKIGEGWCFFANGISYIAVITGLLMMRRDPFRTKPASTSAWRTIREGFQYVFHTAPIRVLLILIAIVSFAGLHYAVLMPIFADQILHEGSQGFGILMGVSGMGALCGALILASRTGVRGLGAWVAGATSIFSVSLAGFAFSGRLWLSCTMLFITGFAVMIQMGASNTLIQSMVPDHLRGRVMSAYSMMYIGMGPFGAMASGFAAERIGAPMTIALGAGICLIAATAFAFRLPAFRIVARELIVAQETAGGMPPPEITASGAE